MNLRNLLQSKINENIRKRLTLQSLDPNLVVSVGLGKKNRTPEICTCDSIAFERIQLLHVVGRKFPAEYLSVANDSFFCHRLGKRDPPLLSAQAFGHEEPSGEYIG